MSGIYNYKIIVLLMLGLFMIGLYEFHRPSYLIHSSSEQKEMIEMSGYYPIKQTDISGWNGTATWEVSKIDSLGNKIIKYVDVKKVDKVWTVQPK